MPSTDINGQPILILSRPEAYRVMEALCEDPKMQVTDPLFLKVTRFIGETVSLEKSPKA